MAATYAKAADWRWQQAVAQTACNKDGHNKELSNDPLVNFVVRLITANQKTSSRRFITQKFPDIMEIIRLGSQNSQQPIRCQLDIQILTYDSNDKVLKNLSWLSKRALKFYKAVFFDIDQHRQDTAWLQQFVMLPAKSARKFQLFRSRKMAVQQGQTAARFMYRWGLASAPTKDAVKRMYNTERLKQAFDYVIGIPELPLALKAPALQTTIGKINDRDFSKQMHSPQNQQNQTILQMAQNIEKAVRTYTSAERAQSLQNPVDNSMDTIQTIIKESNTQQEDA